MNRRGFLRKILGGAATIPIVAYTTPPPTLWKKVWTWFKSWLWPVPDFKRIVMPLVRRIYPNLIAEKIYSVQPLSEPAGLKYYLNYRYSQTKTQTTSSPCCWGERIPPGTPEYKITADDQSLPKVC